MTRSVAAGVVVVGFGVLGVAMFAAPDQVAAAFGLPGSDEFAYRSGGAAFIGYALAFAAGWAAPRGAFGILWPATMAAAGATAVAAVAAVAIGGRDLLGPSGLVMGAGALVFAAVAAASRESDRILPERTGRRFSPWFVAFLGWGVVASALFGLGGLILGSTFGSVAGFPGGDDPIYRLAGAATIGVLVGSVLALRTQDWQQVRLPVVMSFTTNLLTLLGGALYIAGGGVPPVAYLIAGAAIFNVVGLGLALAGRR